MEYEMEQRSQSTAIAGDVDVVVREDRYNYPITEAYHYKSETIPPITFPTIISTTSGTSGKLIFAR